MFSAPQNPFSKRQQPSISRFAGRIDGFLTWGVKYLKWVPPFFHFFSPRKTLLQVVSKKSRHKKERICITVFLRFASRHSFLDMRQSAVRAGVGSVARSVERPVSSRLSLPVGCCPHRTSVARGAKDRRASKVRRRDQSPGPSKSGLKTNGDGTKKGKKKNIDMSSMSS